MNFFPVLSDYSLKTINLIEYVCFLLFIFGFLYQTKVFHPPIFETEEDMKKRRTLQIILLTIIFGFLSIYATVSAMKLMGAIVNARDLAPLIAGMIGGPIAGIGAGIIGGIHRYIYGLLVPAAGFTKLACALATVFAGVIGGLIYTLRKGEYLPPWAAAVIGAMIEVFHMGFVLIFSHPFNQAFELVKVLIVPMIIANSLGLFLFTILLKYYKKLADEKAKSVKLESEMHVVNSLQTDILPNLNREISINSQEQKDFKWLIPYLDKKKFKKNHVLFKKKDKADMLYLIKEGCIRLLEIDKCVSNGEILGEIGIFSPFHERTSSAVCDTDIEIYAADQVKLMELIKEYPNLLFDLAQLSIKRSIVNLQETIAQKERIESELKIAKKIQESMLPIIFPDQPEINVFALMEPARAVGGDFYDFFFIDKSRFCFLIGDVSGKGIPAALFMVVIKTLLKTVALSKIPVDRVLNMVNAFICPDNTECMFATVFITILDINTGKLDYANAGHNPPMYFKKNTGFDFLTTAKRFVLGGMPDVRYVEESLTMKPGEVIILYTDGVNEAMNPEGEQYSNKRFKDLLKNYKSESARHISRKIRESVGEFVRDAEQSDDITILSVCYEGPET